MNERIWKPNVTVAALIERDGHYLMVEEETDEGIRFNQPAGHLDEGESLIAACAREALEETAWHFAPAALVGIYQWTRPQGNALRALPFGQTPGTPSHPPSPGEGGDQLAPPVGRSTNGGERTTYLRFAFSGNLGAHEPERALDAGILRAVWMTPVEIEANRPLHRSPLIWQCVQDHAAGRRFPLDLIKHYSHG